MKYLSKKSFISLTAVLCCVACNPLSDLEAQKEALLSQLKQCPPSETQNNTTEAEKLNDCQKELTHQLQNIDQEIYKAKFGDNYSELKPYTNGYWLAIKKPFFAIQRAKIGILDPNGKEIIEPKYFDFAQIQTKKPLIPYADHYFLDIPNLPNPLIDHYNYLFPIIYLQDTHGKWGGIHLETGQEVIPFRYKLPHLQGDHILLIEEDEQGNEISEILVNQQGKTIFKPSLYGKDFYDILDEHYIAVYQDNKSILLKDQKEIIVLDDKVHFSIRDKFIFVESRKTLDRKIYSLDGHLLFEADNSYVNVLSPNSDLIYIESFGGRGKNKLIDTSGKILFSDIYNVSKITDSLFSLENHNRKEAIIDLKGNLLTDFTYDGLSSLDEKHHLIKFFLNNKEGVMDTNLDIILPAIYDDIAIRNNKLFVSQYDKTTVFTLDGRPFTKIPHNYIYQQGNFIVVGRDKKEALLSSEGKALTPFEYDKASIHTFTLKNKEENTVNHPYHIGDLAFAQIQGKYGVIDSIGNIIIPFEYEHLRYLTDNLFAFKLNGKFGIFDINKHIIFDAVYDEIKYSYYNPHLFFVKQNNQSGVIDIKGNIIIPLIYEELREYQQYLFLRKEGKWGLFDLNQHQFMTDIKYDTEFVANIVLSHGLFSTKWHDELIFITTEGKYPASYLQRLEDNKTLFGVRLLPKMTISDTPTSEGKTEFEQFETLLKQFKNHLLDFENIADQDLEKFIQKVHLSLENKKEEVQAILTHSFKDSEMAYLANLYLNATYLDIQFLNKLKEELTSDVEGISMDLYIHLLLDYLNPKNIAIAEMKDVKEKLQLKYK
ncbi:WG repeat-containing protein [Pelistega sp. NLN82]|uniref:WG repeat-containing protein n=1 Tax=Pelistega ratti TaxID=2652177 RepID=A0A6L9Y5D0_9BURK|nr:WG repeat-containing protein [Pelistega ratti]NEN75692.1 WG repeat-containing protein [Pelistega ratti]